MKTLSKYLVKKHAALVAEQARLAAEYEEQRKEWKTIAPADRTVAGWRNEARYQDLKARSAANYEARKNVDNALAAFIEKHTKAPKLPDALKRGFSLNLTYPRDGMGRLKLASNNAPMVYVSGCGYDKRGAVLGKWINETFGAIFQELNALHVERFYGMTAYSGVVKVDGACGENCMINILEWLGYEVTSSCDAKGRYIVGYSVAYKGA